MEIEQISLDGHKGSFKATESGKWAGEMSYTWAGEERIIIDHTEVDDAFRGRGIGHKLVEAIVSFAREKQISIIPLCPFAKSVFDKEPALRDVL